MKKLGINIILFFIALLLLCTVGVYGLFYTLISSIFKYNKISFIEYWTKLFYSINIGIDQLGNVTLAAFLNRYTIKTKEHLFGNVKHTISYVLAVNYFNNNLKILGKILVWILNYIDKDHMKKSLF